MSPAHLEAQEENRQLLAQREALMQRLNALPTLQLPATPTPSAESSLQLPSRAQVAMATAGDWHSRHLAGGRCS